MGNRELTKGSKDIKGMSEGGVSSRTKCPRADVTNVHPVPTLPKDILSEDEWCAYGGLPSPRAYMRE